jgi:hypothetical protein
MNRSAGLSVGEDEDRIRRGLDTAPPTEELVFHEQHGRENLRTAARLQKKIETTVAARCGRKRAKPGRQNPSAIDRHPAARFNQKIEPGGGCCGRRKSGQVARRPEQSGPAKRNTARRASVAGKKNREHRRRPAARFGRKPRANPSALKTSPKMKPGRALATSGRPTHEHARMYLLQGRKSGQRPRQTKRTEIKAMNTRRKISDLVPT